MLEELQGSSDGRQIAGVFEWIPTIDAAVESERRVAGHRHSAGRDLRPTGTRPGSALGGAREWLRERPDGSTRTRGNSDIMRGKTSGSVDPIYLDPPFDSKVDDAGPRASRVAGAAPEEAWDPCVDGLRTGEDKTMEIVKSMSRMGHVLLVLTSTTAAAAEGGPYWAVATAWEVRGETGLFHLSTYGAAWDFASLEEAERAAMETCGKHVPDSWNSRRWMHGGCNISATGNNSCFAILSRDSHDRFGTVTAYGVLGEGYPSSAEAEAAAKREAADTFINSPGTILDVGIIELVECAGVR